MLLTFDLSLDGSQATFLCNERMPNHVTDTFEKEFEKSDVESLFFFYFFASITVQIN